MTASIATRQNRTGIVQGEFLLTIEDFRCLAGMLHADAGISLAESKATLLYSRLARRLRALGLSDFQQYCELLADPAAKEERGRMLAALTTNVTRFFREPHHFEHLQGKVLPPLLAAARRGGRVRIWSAACSNGQEPYTVALTILALMPEAAKHDVRVLATDIDPNMLAEGRAGQYSAEALEPVPTAQRQRWFHPAGTGQWEVADELKRLVTFREVNLIGAWPMRGPFDAILCRNVMIYFAEDTQATVWHRFTPLLPPGGHLYIGHSERLNGPAAECFETVGITTYRRRAPRA
jgi:chemotaxis protein methyltransferase CheR